MKNIGDFFSYFKFFDFDLEIFFWEIFLGGKFDLRVKFLLVLKGVNVNLFDLFDLLWGFIFRISDKFDFYFLNVFVISYMIDFFWEFGFVVS